MDKNERKILENEYELHKLKKELDELLSTDNFDFNCEIVNLSQKIDILVIAHMRKQPLFQKYFCEEGNYNGI